MQKPQSMNIPKSPFNPKTNINQLVSTFIKGLSPYIKGKSLRETEEISGVSADKILKLASNENLLGPSLFAVEAAQQALSAVNIYPESQRMDLLACLAGRVGVDADNVVMGNGSNELIDIIARAFLTHETECIYGDPAFFVYYTASQSVGAKLRPVPLKNFTHDLDAILMAITPDTRVIFIANPNNPTGTLVPKDKIAAFLSNVPKHVVVVLDEAYYEYSPEEDFVKPAAWIGRNVIFLRTFSKFFALAGLRVGYAICSPEIAEVLNRVREPFNVNTLAIASAFAALGDKEHGKRTLETLKRSKAILEEGYKKLGLSFVPTKANFHLVDTKRKGGVIAAALQKRGVIVRPVENYGLKTHLRITIGIENELFLQILEDVLLLIPKMDSNNNDCSS